MNVVIGVVQGISRVMAWIAGLIIVALMTIIVAEVVARYLLDTTIGGSIEIGELLLALMVFLSLAYAQQDRAHVSTSLLTARLRPSVRTAVRLVGLTVVLVVVVWASAATLDRGLTSLANQEATFGIRSVPLWPGRLLVPFGLAMLALELLITMREVVRSRHEVVDDPLADNAAAHA